MTDPEERARQQRAAPRRGAPPGRPQTGWPVTRRWLFITIGVLVVVTTTLVVVLLRSV